MAKRKPDFSNVVSESFQAGYASEPDMEQTQVTPEVEDDKEKKELKSSKIELVTRTYYLTPELIEAIRLLAFYRNKDKSELMREILTEYIPTDIMEQAKTNVGI